MLSFWERESFTHYDFIIIGAGIVGCSTAYHLKLKHPDASIAILERGIFPSGASSKNAGFACFGSLTELIDDLPTLGETALIELVQKRLDGLNKLKSILGEEAIDYKHYRGFELIREKEVPVLDKIGHFNELLQGVFKADVFRNEPKLVETFGFNAKHIRTIVSNQFEGQVDTGKMMNAWWTICNKLGVKIFTGVEVSSIEQEHDVIIKNPLYGSIAFKAGKVAICTNAFATKFVPDEDITPGRGMVMVSMPIKDLPFKGVFHYDEGYFYFRNVGNRLLIGGGRNLDKTTENTHEFGINTLIKKQILETIKQTILPNKAVEMDMEWSGIMAFGDTKLPIVKMVGKSIAIGVRLGGMGVAIGTQVGEQISELLAERD